MPSLLELQTAFAGAVLDRPGEALLQAIAADGIAAEHRLAIYRNHYRITLEEALATTFPVVRQLVGSGFFAAAAHRFIAAMPPTAPCLFEYGAGFSGTLAGLPELRRFAFVPDVARLEWAFNVAYHAADHRPLTAADFADIAPEDYPRLRLALAPSAVLFASPYPALEIWQAHREGKVEAASIAVSGEPCRLLLLRQDDEVAWRELDAAEFAFLAALRRGLPLDLAHQLAMRHDTVFELASALGWLLAEGLLAQMRV